MSADVRAALFLALGVAGTPAAQDALCAQAITEGADVDGRLHAIVALHDIAQPTSSSLGALSDIVHAGIDAPEGRAALMAIASWAGRTDPATRVAGAEALLDGVLPELLRGEPALALAAIGNHGGARYTLVVEASLSDSRPAVRRAAVDAVARWAPADQWRALAPRVAAEADDDVLTGVLVRLTSAISAGALADAATLTAAGSHLDSDSTDVRGAAVDLLGTGDHTDDALRTRLRARFRIERDASVRRRIGRYLTARELAE